MPNDNAHFVAILVAVALPVAVWIGSDYLAQVPAEPERVTNDGRAPVPVSEAPKSAIPASVSELVAPPAVRPERVIEDAMVSRRPSSGAIHKCRVQGQIVYSDLPCNAGTAVKTFAPSVAAAVSADAQRIPAPANPVADAQAVRTTPSALPAVAAADTVASEIAKRQAECKWIDERIAAIDARLRQPYYPQEGDRLKEERKAQYDRRFSLGC